ncbi:MAG: NAD(P)-binding domain-containing protein [Planctomycetes bacterium]|nr:NAD(P)-binding domain-containing protein [Planctomycetota bacterium]
MAKKLAILGAGPIGLEAALYARALQMPFTIFERGRVGEYWQRWGHVRLFSPFGMNVTSLGRSAIAKHNPEHEFPGDDALLSGREHLAAYLQPLADILEDNLQTDTHVMLVGRRGFLKNEDPEGAGRSKQPFRLLLRDKKSADRIEEADIVLDCTGTYGQHCWAGEGGIPSVGEVTSEPHIAYGLEDILGERRPQYANKSILVVGGGYSAATTVSSLAKLAEDNQSTWVTWLARCPGSQPLKRIPNDSLKERDRLAVRANNLATRTDANVEFHAQTVVEGIEFQGQDRGFRVTMRSAGKAKTLEFDRIIANVGYTPDRMIYRELHIHECYASAGPMKLAAALLGEKSQDCLRQASYGADTLRTPEPNFYILGAKSYGRNSNFLVRVGFEQVRDVFTLITGKAGLDLYKGLRITR